MPETRLAKTRQTLPPAYQFGDAASDAAMEALDESDGSRVIARTDMRGHTLVWQSGAPRWAVEDLSRSVTNAIRAMKSISGPMP